MKALFVMSKYKDYPQPPADILAWSPSYDTQDGSMVSRLDADTATILLKAGGRLSVPPTGEHRSNYAHTATTYTYGETVGEALANMGVSIDQVARIEVTIQGHDYTEGSCHDDWMVEYWFVPEQDEQKTRDEIIANAARAFATGKIGFKDLKRVIRNK